MGKLRQENNINIKRKLLIFILISLAITLIILGVYYRFQPEYFIRNDIREYNEGLKQFNKGVEIYQEAMSGLKEDDVAYDTYFDKNDVSGVDKLIKDSFDNAISHFNNVILESKNNELKSLSYYNIGTLVGIIMDDIRFREDVRYEPEVAFNKLREAIKYNPYNEDAKYNLELLESMYNLEPLEGEEGEEQIMIPGYTKGILKKGF